MWVHCNCHTQHIKHKFKSYSVSTVIMACDILYIGLWFWFKHLITFLSFLSWLHFLTFSVLSIFASIATVFSHVSINSNVYLIYPLAIIWSLIEAVGRKVQDIYFINKLSNGALCSSFLRVLGYTGTICYKVWFWFNLKKSFYTSSKNWNILSVNTTVFLSAYISAWTTKIILFSNTIFCPLGCMKIQCNYIPNTDPQRSTKTGTLSQF
jgi:hypothetical protein